MMRRTGYPAIPHMDVVGGLSGCENPELGGGWVSGLCGVLGFVEGFEGQGLEFGDEFVESAGVVEPLLVALLLLGGDRSCDGLACHGSRPGEVRAVELRRVALAATAGPAAFGAAPGEAARERESGLGEFTCQPCLGSSLPPAGLSHHGHLPACARRYPPSLS